MIRWYVASTQPRQEARAEVNLCRQGFDAWLPRIQKVRRHARKIDRVVVPLFPGYLFVRFDATTDRWRSINGTVGVVRLLCQGDVPQSVPESLIDEIMRRRDAEGLVQLPPRRFVVGQQLRVVSGAFADLEGFYEGMSGRDRVVLLLNMLGRQVRAIVPSAELAA